MIQRVGGPPPVPSSNLGDTPSPPPPAEYNAILAAWCLFYNSDLSSHGDYNNPHFWSMLQNSIKEFKAQWGNQQPADAPSAAIWKLLTKDIMVDGSGNPESLMDLASSQTPQQFMNTASFEYQTGDSNFMGVFNQLQPAIGAWFGQSYPSGSTEPPPTPPAALGGQTGDWATLYKALKALQGDYSGSPTYDTNVDNVVAAITAMDATLTAAQTAGTLDGYGQFLLNFMTSDFDTKGTSLDTIASTIKTGGGSAKDPQDAGYLTAWLFSDQNPGGYFANPAPHLGYDLQNWVSDILMTWEIPPS